jgi:hypothetical protein
MSGISSVSCCGINIVAKFESKLFLGYILENNWSGHNPFYRSVCSCGDLAERGKCEFTNLSH